jgi:hypothetical protein
MRQGFARQSCQSAGAFQYRLFPASLWSRMSLLMTKRLQFCCLPVWYGLKRAAKNPGISLPFGTDPSAQPQRRGSAMRGSLRQSSIP